MPNDQAMREELAHRRHNLTVIQEIISEEGKPASKLIEVRDLLVRRIQQLERDLQKESLTLAV